jgi:polar amino acid transport system substrate-binding protein
MTKKPHRALRWGAAFATLLALTATTACSTSSEAGTAAATDSAQIAKIKETKTLRCASSNDPPVLYKGSSGEPAGLFYEMLTQMLDKAGLADVKVVPEYMPFQSVIPALLSKRVDLVCDTMNMTPERRKQIDFTLPILNNTDVVVVRPGNPAGINAYADMKGKVCGTYEGTLWVPWCDELGARTEIFPTQQDAIAGVAAGRVDGAFLDILSASYALRENPNLNVEIADPYKPKDADSPVNYAAMGLRKDSTDLKKMLDDAYREMRADGSFEALLVKWNYNPDNMLTKLD